MSVFILALSQQIFNFLISHAARYVFGPRLCLNLSQVLLNCVTLADGTEGPTGRPKTSVTTYKSTLRNIPEDHGTGHYSQQWSVSLPFP